MMQSACVSAFSAWLTWAEWMFISLLLVKLFAVGEQVLVFNTLRLEEEAAFKKRYKYIKFLFLEHTNLKRDEKCYFTSKGFIFLISKGV